ncbi:MAG: D-alanyl-D-alanine carboxypeptidase/D-alanyl-D-alanine-endopeptidase [Planctomycetota bacterium]
MSFPLRRTLARRAGWPPVAWFARVSILLAVAVFGFADFGSGSDLRSEIDRILSDPRLGDTRLGARVVDLDAGGVVYSVHAEEPFIPASNMKIVVSAAALDRLGADWSFVTRIYTRGAVQGGELRGDLVVWGNGDPNLSGRFYQDDPLYLPRGWVARLRERGVRNIRGDVVLDDCAFDREYRHPSWDPAQNDSWYQAPVSALSFNDNCIDVLVAAGEIGAPARVSLRPTTSYVRLENRLRTTRGGRAELRLVRRKGNSWVLDGTLPSGSTQRVLWATVEDPSLFLGTVLAEEFIRQGGAISGVVRMVSAPVVGKDSNLTLLVEQRSKLSDTIPIMNQRSQNLYAECVLKALGLACCGRGTFADGARAVGDFLQKAGLPPDQYVISDGSGLSRDGRLSPLVLTEVLAKIYRSPDADVFVNSLAEPGQGTLRRRLLGGEVEGRIFAKTGYIRSVSALSGYVFSRSGRAFAFSILVNDLRCSTAVVKSCQDEVCRTLANQ